MAPELLEGGPPDTVTDVYALGVVLFHLATGRYPYESNSLSKLMGLHHEGRPHRLQDLRPDLNPGFVRVVEKALTPDPQERFQTAGEFETALAGCLGAAPQVGSPKPKRRRGLVLAAVAAAVLAGVLIPSSGILTPSFDLEAGLYRQTAAGDVRMDPGTAAPGDAIYLKVEGNRASHVYVFNADKAGNRYTLFPDPNASMSNPLQAGRSYRLPNLDDIGDNFWRVDAVGAGQFVVVASVEPLPWLEAQLNKLSAAHHGEQDAELLAYGVDRGVSVGTNPTGTESVYDHVVKQAKELAAQSNTVVVWEIDLDTP